MRTANLLLWAYIPFLLVIRQSDDGAAIFILSMIFLGLLQLIVYKLTLSLVKNPAFPFTPKPGQVTLDNLNEHTCGEKTHLLHFRFNLPPSISNCAEGTSSAAWPSSSLCPSSSCSAINPPAPLNR